MNIEKVKLAFQTRSLTWREENWLISDHYRLTAQVAKLQARAEKAERERDSHLEFIKGYIDTIDNLTERLEQTERKGITAGLRLGAEICELNSVKDWTGGSTGNAVGTANRIANALLTKAAEIEKENK